MTPRMLLVPAAGHALAVPGGAAVRDRGRDRATERLSEVAGAIIAPLGVPFRQRGAILDEQLDVLARCWPPGPVSYHGKHYSFDEVWPAPGPFRPDGPPLWFGGQRMHPALLRRLVRWGSGFTPRGRVSYQGAGA
jgi:hypothetical protein